MTILNGRTVDLFSNEDFKQYLIDENITKLAIVFDESDVNDPQIQNFELYSVTGGGTDSAVTAGSNKIEYTLTKHIDAVYDDETGEEITPEYNYNFLDDPTEFDYSTAVFTSTEMTDYNITVNWHDRGASRPDADFTIYSNGSVYQPDLGQPTITNVNSNCDIHTYHVPKNDINGTAITYTSEMTTVPANYREVKNNDTYNLFGLTEFNFTLDWKDGTSERHIDQFCGNDASLKDKVKRYINGDTTITSADISTYINNVISYIKAHFTLKNRSMKMMRHLILLLI